MITLLRGLGCLLPSASRARGDEMSTPQGLGPRAVLMAVLKFQVEAVCAPAAAVHGVSGGCSNPGGGSGEGDQPVPAGAPHITEASRVLSGSLS